MFVNNEYIIRKIEELASDIERMDPILHIYPEECFKIIDDWYEFINRLYDRIPIYFIPGSETEHLRSRIDKIRYGLTDIWIDTITGRLIIPELHISLNELKQLCRT